MRRIILTATLASLALPLTPAMAARTYSGWTSRSTTMRAGPDYYYPAIRRIRRNSQIRIYGCLNDWSWCDVSYRYDRGWVAGHDLVANYQGRRRGISSYLGIGILNFIFGDYWDNHYRDRTFYSDRSRWERRYYDNYQPHWGPRPNTPLIYQNRTRVNAPVQIQPRAKVTPQVRPVPDRNRKLPVVNQNKTRVNAPVQIQPRAKVTPQVRPVPDRNRKSSVVNQKRATQTSTPPAPAGNDNKGHKANKKVKQVDQTKPK